MKESEPIQLWQAHNGNASLSPAIEALRREVEEELSVPRRQVRELLGQLMGGRPEAGPDQLTLVARLQLSVDLQNPGPPEA